jgi:flagellar basal body-associated protein FliL
MKFSARLSIKFLLVWGVSIALALVLVGVVFFFLLGTYHQSSAQEAIGNSFERMNAQFEQHDKLLENAVYGLARDRDVIAISNLLNKYQDKKNYQPLLFDKEKKTLARLSTPE